MSGLGSAPLGTFTLGVPLADPGESTTRLVASRKIDGVTKTYVIDENGNFEGMADTASRVLLLVAFAVKVPKSITPQSDSAGKASIRAALRVLTDGRSPAAKLVDVQVTHPVSGSSRYDVVFIDLLAGGRDPETVSVEVA